MAQDDNLQENNNSQNDNDLPNDNNQREDENLLRHLLRAIIVLVLLFFVYLLWLALPGSKPAIECETTDEAPTLITTRDPNKSRFFVDNQVIVIGPISAVEAVLADFKLILLRKCDLHYLSEPSDRVDSDQRYFPFPDDARRELTMRLYHIPDGRPVAEVVEAINQAGSGRHVFADPNLLMGLLHHNACGNPNEDGGSPFNGAPKLLPVGEESIKLFWEQWAFQHVGVGRPLKDALDGTTVMHQGEGVLVGVFDTSPFLDPWIGVANGEAASEIETQEIVKWVTPTMDVERLSLKVSYPELVNTLTAPDRPDEIDPNTADDVRDHGLFVAGLVHAVAPASELYLIRVLNEDGCGDLFTLNEALARFTGEAKKVRGTLEGVVINLSLGVHNPEDAEENENATPNECGPETPDEDDLVSLCTALSAAYNEGAVIVAAAGNDSDNEEVPLPAQIPAAYAFVIGVQASNINRQLACFSNEGGVSAPGGDGVAEDCAAGHQACAGDCAEAVISLVLFPPEQEAYWPTHYGYWSGTSFSAPLVSGLAALVSQAGVENDGSGTTWPDPASVTTVIHCGATPPPDGVIDIPATLSRCLP